MINILAITEYDKPFVYLTTGQAFKNLSSYIDCTVTILDFRHWFQSIRQQSIKANDIDLLICESVYIELNRFTITFLRSIYPNAKIVVLGSDTIYYITTGKNNGYQFDSPLEVDLFLEKMDVCIEEYQKRGVNVDSWMWTASDELLDYIEAKDKYYTQEREFDFIGVYHPISINNIGSYRQRMVQYLTDHGYKFTQGGGTGHEDQNYDRLFSHYRRSWFTLGTTSHNNPLFHSMKGFRDWIGPAMGALLIYDDYPDVIKKFHGGTLVPTYPYEDFKAITEIADYYKNDLEAFNSLLELQKKWARANTIEKQLHKLFLEHHII